MPADKSFHLIEACRLGWRAYPEMVARSFEPGTNVSALAREIGISPAQFFGWRADALKRNEVESHGGDAVSVIRIQQTMARFTMTDFGMQANQRFDRGARGRVASFQQCFRCNESTGASQ